MPCLRWGSRRCTEPSVLQWHGHVAWRYSIIYFTSLLSSPSPSPFPSSPLLSSSLLWSFISSPFPFSPFLLYKLLCSPQFFLFSHPPLPSHPLCSLVLPSPLPSSHLSPPLSTLLPAFPFRHILPSCPLSLLSSPNLPSSHILPSCPPYHLSFLLVSSLPLCSQASLDFNS